SDRAGGAYKPVPPLGDPADIGRLRAPEFSYDADAAERQTCAVRDLVGEALPLAFHCNATHNGPFEWAVRLRGMDNLLLDVYDRPEWLKELMAFLSEAIVDYHSGREAAGCVFAPTECALHSPWDDFSSPRGDGAPAPLRDVSKLSASWGYLHAQSSASYGPDAYAEFVQPYNVPIAELFGMVYYHACETMDLKAPIIRDLPNLRQFHVSPWSDPSACAEALPPRVVMEVHSHPTNVLLLWGEDEMREELEGLVEASGDQPFNLKLCDIQTINEDAGQALITWSRVAKQVVS
ncbi:MAG TPA: hypothetical protein QGH10_19935, partial [Armatimonadota bacterium]|nr:hypothetical protein [Armatimonadota bacterium]